MKCYSPNSSNYRAPTTEMLPYMLCHFIKYYIINIIDMLQMRNVNKGSDH